jgi:homocysteine S-methyltransferase
MAVGINCTKPELITGLLRSAKSGKPFIVYPNSGRVWDAKNKVWTGSATAGFSNTLINEWIEAGAEIIGGCCGIGTAQISEMSLSN